MDNVHWFPQINTTPCLVGEGRQVAIPNAYFPRCYMSNCVTIVKQRPNSGKKFNPVWFTIEAGDEKTGIIDTAELEEKLSLAFGKPFGTKYYETRYYFYFNDEEKEHLTEQDKLFAESFNQLKNELKNLVNNATGIQHIKRLEPYGTGASRVSGLSLVKALKKVLPAKHYNYKNRGGSSFTVEKKNENNHSFSLLCDLSPSFKILRAGMVISGYNFKHEIGFAHLGQPKGGFEEIYPDTQEEVEYHVANLAMALRKAEDQLSEELLQLYGKSIV